MSFTFKQFHIADERCAMKVGTDGVLVGAWAPVENCDSILDVGAGSGLVSLILAQRTEGRVPVTAVEYDAGAYADCVANFAASRWSDNLHAVQGDFASLTGVFDMIVSNPPFFAGNLTSPDVARAKARQGDSLSYASLILFAAANLSGTGSLVMITDCRQSNDIIYAAEMVGLKPRRICHVVSKSGKSPFRILWQFSRKDGPIDHATLEIRDAQGRYTDRYKCLTDNFYLNL